MPMETSKRLSIAAETYILFIICLLDLLSTVWLIVTNRAIEGNPVMAFYLDKGLGAFVIAKILIAVFALFVAEWARRHSPKFVCRMLRFGIVAYIGMYMTFFVGTNILAAKGHQFYYDAAIQQKLADSRQGNFYIDNSYPGRLPLRNVITD